MRKTAQRGLDAADNNGHIAIRFLQSIGVDESSAVGACSMYVARRICIVATHLAGRSVMRNHRVHCTGRDGEEKLGLSEYHERLWGTPIRLADNPDTKPMLLEPSGQQRHTE